jgi:hypothetical protein
MKYLIFLIFLSSCSIKFIPPSYTKCDVLNLVLSESHLEDHIKSHENSSSLRIFDLTDYFNDNNCGYKWYSVRVADKLMVDMNTGRFIDISILSVIKKPKEQSFEIVYSKRTPECKQDFFMKGQVVLELKGKDVILKSSYFEAVN